MTLLAGNWFESWETMAGAAVFILYVIGSIVGGAKKPPQSGAPRPPAAPPRQVPRPPRTAAPPMSPGTAGPSGPPRPPRPTRVPTPMVTHAPPATSTLRPAEMRQQHEQQTHRDMPPPHAQPLEVPRMRAPSPPALRPPPRPAAAPPPRPRVVVSDEPPRRRPGVMAEGESALEAHRPLEQGLPSEITEERKLHEVSAEIEAERKAHRLVRDSDGGPRRGDDMRDKLVKVLRSRGGLRGAILLSEIISPPVALRDGHLR